MPYKSISGIYIIVNTINKKCYIGSAVSIKQRFTQHRRLLRQNRHFNIHLQASWNKYGEQAFKFELLERGPVNELVKAEQYWIDFLEVTNPKKGYNKRAIASTNLGIKASEETRKKLSLAHIGYKRSPEAQAKISAAQRKAVVQIDYDGNVVATYQSLQEAVKTTGVYSQGISMCLNGTIQRTGGYYWCLESNIESFTIPAPRLQRYRTKTILQCDTIGNVIKEWSSITEIAKHLGVSNSLLTAKLKSNKPFKNYLWKYKNFAVAST
jgi:hypothetical protein